MQHPHCNHLCLWLHKMTLSPSSSLPSLTFTHTHLRPPSHWLCDYCRLVRDSYRCCDGSGCRGCTHKHTVTLPGSLSVPFPPLFLAFAFVSRLRCVLSLGAVERRRCGVASALALPSRVPVQEIGIKARHELIGPAGQTAHYNAQQGPTAGVKRAQYLLIIYSSSLSVSLRPSLSHWLLLSLCFFFFISFSFTPLHAFSFLCYFSTFSFASFLLFYSSLPPLIFNLPFSFFIFFSIPLFHLSLFFFLSLLS